MGLSFYDQKSLEETVESLCFASRNEDPVSETGDSVIADFADQEKIDRPISFNEATDDIQLVGR